MDTTRLTSVLTSLSAMSAASSSSKSKLRSHEWQCPFLPSLPLKKKGVYHSSTHSLDPFLPPNRVYSRDEVAHFKVVLVFLLPLLSPLSIHTACTDKALLCAPTSRCRRRYSLAVTTTLLSSHTKRKLQSRSEKSLLTPREGSWEDSSSEDPLPAAMVMP